MTYEIRKEKGREIWGHYKTYENFDALPEECKADVALLDAVAEVRVGIYTEQVLEGVGFIRVFADGVRTVYLDRYSREDTDG